MNNPRPLVIALGGNALLQRGQPLEAELQQHNIQIAAKAIAEIAKDYPVVVTHGNGPQVGLLALQAEADKSVKPYPLDVLGAETEGMIGYLLEQELRNHLPSETQVVTLLTQIEVNPNDSAFSKPTKFIGPVYSETQARELATARGWAIAPDGQYYRRVVPSPEPQRILELATLQLLVNAGALVVCAGGGGIPVQINQGIIHGVEAVIDKDLAACLLAKGLNAQGLLLLTDVDAVYENWGENYAHALHQTNPKQLRRYRFASGSMGPKVDAACRFVEQTGAWAAIGKLEEAAEMLSHNKGTIICFS